MHNVDFSGGWDYIKIERILFRFRCLEEGENDAVLINRTCIRKRRTSFCTNFNVLCSKKRIEEAIKIGFDKVVPAIAKKRRVEELKIKNTQGASCIIQI